MPLPPESVAAIRQGVVGLARRMRAGRPPGALSNTKLSLLGYLHRHGPVSAGELAAAEHQQPQSLTRVLSQLERDGLVTRTRDERDGRRCLVALSAAGASALATDMAARDAWLAAAMGGLTETERQVLVLAAGLMDRIASDIQ